MNRMTAVDLWCWNKKCSDYRIKGKKNIVEKERIGKFNHMLYRCRTCEHCFSETRGTPFFGLQTPRQEILRTLAMIPEKGSLRGVARATGHRPITISTWVKRAGSHSYEVMKHLFQNLELTQVQIDEIWAYIKKKEKR